MILKYFRRKIQRKKIGVFGLKQSSSMQNFDLLVFEKNANFVVAENCPKSQKIVIITSIPVRLTHFGATFFCRLPNFRPSKCQNLNYRKKNVEIF
jgi:hypothetical protein